MFESLGCAILNTAYSKTVCGEAWLNDFRERTKTDLKFFPTTSFYVFGNGNVVQARKKVFLPFVINGDAFDVSCDMVSDNVPFFFSQKTMEGTETVIDMKQKKVTMFGKEVPISKTSTGLTMIDVIPPREIENTFEAFAEEAETALVCNFIEDKLDKVGICKLHAQLGHALFEKMKRLLMDEGLNNPDSISTLKEVIDSFEICKVHKKTPAKPCTSFTRARSVNECVAIDLHQLDASTSYLHIRNRPDIRLNPVPAGYRALISSSGSGPVSKNFDGFLTDFSSKRTSKGRAPASELELLRGGLPSEIA